MFHVKRGISRTFAVLIAFVPVTSHADAPQFWGGDKLYEVCATGADPIVRVGCFSYVMAVADILNAGDSISGSRACLPTNMPAGDAADVVEKWLREHPENRHYSAASVAAGALAEAFPCP